MVIVQPLQLIWACSLVLDGRQGRGDDRLIDGSHHQGEGDDGEDEPTPRRAVGRLDGG